MKAEMKERTLEWVCIVILGIVAIGSIYAWSKEYDKAAALKNDNYTYSIEKFQDAKHIKELKSTNAAYSTKLEETQANVKRLEQLKIDKDKQLAQKNAKIAKLEKVKVKKK
jgi:hypothetical protein